MRAFIVVFLVASTTISMDTEDILAQIKAIDSDEFGKTLIDTLQMTMSSGEPIERFTQIMRDLESQIEQEQRTEDQKDRNYQAKCDADLQNIQSEVANFERRLVEIQSLLDQLKPQINARTKVRSEKTEWKKNIDNQIQSLDAERKSQSDEFNQRAAEHQNAQFVIDTVRRMFADDSTTSSFLQTNHRGVREDQVQKVKSHIEDNLTQQTRKSYTGMFKLLSQIASGMTADPETLNKVVSLCDQMLRSIEDSASNDRAAEKQRESVYQTERGFLKKDSDKLEQQLATLNAEIEQTQQKINDTQTDQADTTTRQQQKLKQQEDRTKDCRESAFMNAKAREKRTQNRELVSKIIGLFTVNQRDFAAYVKARTDAGDFQ